LQCVGTKLVRCNFPPVIWNAAAVISTCIIYGACMQTEAAAAAIAEPGGMHACLVSGCITLITMLIK